MKTKHAPLYLEPIHHLDDGDDTVPNRYDSYLDHQDFLDEAETLPISIVKVERQRDERPWYERIMEEMDSDDLVVESL